MLRIVRGTDNLNQPVDIAGSVALGERGQPPVQPIQLGVQAVALRADGAEICLTVAPAGVDLGVLGGVS